AGSLWQLYAAALMFIAASLGLGLFVSTLAQTQFQAFQLAFVTMLPSILLSGFLFPFEGMPQVAQWIAQILPLTHFNVMIRGIMLRGADHCATWGIPSKGNRKPESRMEGSMVTNASWKAWNC